MRRTTYKELCDNVDTKQLINEKFKECKHLIKNIRKDNLMQRLRDKDLSLVQSLDRLDDEICWGLLGIWGLAYDDISDIDLSYLTAKQLSRIPFSKQTKFPDKEFLPNGFNQHEIINRWS